MHLENYLLAIIAGNDAMLEECLVIGETVQVIAAARHAWRVLNGDVAQLEDAFSKDVVEAATSDWVDGFLDHFEALNLVTTTKPGDLH